MKNKQVLTILAVLFLVPLWSWSQDSLPQNNATTPTQMAADPTSEAAAQAIASSAAFKQRNPRYQLCPGDVMDIVFEFSPEFNQQGVAIQPDGFVTLRGIGDVHVAGMTVPETTRLLHSSYSSFLADPAISVLLKDFNKPYFIASGMVAKPGKYDLRADTTVAEAIAISGGLAPGAKHSQVIVFRRASNDMLEAKEIDVKAMLGHKNLREDLHLQPGDMVYVPQNKISKIRQWLPTPGMAINPATL